MSLQMLQRVGKTVESPGDSTAHGRARRIAIAKPAKRIVLVEIWDVPRRRLAPSDSRHRSRSRWRRYPEATATVKRALRRQRWSGAHRSTTLRWSCGPGPATYTCWLVVAARAEYIAVLMSAVRRRRSGRCEEACGGDGGIEIFTRDGISVAQSPATSGRVGRWHDVYGCQECLLLREQRVVSVLAQGIDQIAPAVWRPG